MIINCVIFVIVYWLLKFIFYMYKKYYILYKELLNCIDDVNTTLTILR